MTPAPVALAWAPGRWGLSARRPCRAGCQSCSCCWPCAASGSSALWSGRCRRQAAGPAGPAGTAGAAAGKGEQACRCASGRCKGSGQQAAARVLPLHLLHTDRAGAGVRLACTPGQRRRGCGRVQRPPARRQETPWLAATCEPGSCCTPPPPPGSPPTHLAAGAGRGRWSAGRHGGLAARGAAGAGASAHLHDDGVGAAAAAAARLLRVFDLRPVPPRGDDGVPLLLQQAQHPALLPAGARALPRQRGWRASRPGSPCAPRAVLAGRGRGRIEGHAGCPPPGHHMRRPAVPWPGLPACPAPPPTFATLRGPCPPSCWSLSARVPRGAAGRARRRWRRGRSHPRRRTRPAACRPTGSSTCAPPRVGCCCPTCRASLRPRCWGRASGS
jgi:hypothetical protein